MTQDVAAPLVKGWCPGAHRPMLSGDGLVFRVRPFHGALSADQARGLCALSERFGNGVLDLTSRANIQIRGVAEADQSALLEALDGLDLIDADPRVEGHRNILMPYDWTPGDLTWRLARAILAALPRMPDLPEKMGFAIDTGAAAQLGQGSADFRLELDASGGLMLRADGAATGVSIPEAEVPEALLTLAAWFLQTGGRAAGRMTRHLATTPLPERWLGVAPRATAAPPQPGVQPHGTILGAPFGKIAARDLRALLADPSVTQLRPMLGRMLFLPGAEITEAAGFVTAPSRLMDVHACPGAPFCPQATVETMQIAHRLAERSQGTLHVSGCAKGCAHPKAAATTLTGRAGRYDLVLDGRPWDEPAQSGLTAEHAIQTLRGE